MELDLSKFGALAAEAQPEHDSVMYVQLMKAFDVIYDLTVVKKIKRKKVIAMLQESGLKELDEIKMNGWWNSTLTKKRREEHAAALEKAEEVKGRAKEAWGREVDTSKKVSQQEKNEVLGNVKSKPAESVSTQKEAAPEVEDHRTARQKRASIPASRMPNASSQAPASDRNTIQKQAGDLVVPWPSFLTHVKSKHDWKSGVISATLQDMGIVEKEGGKFTLLADAPEVFVGFEKGDTIVFANLEVAMNTLTSLIEGHLL